MAVITSAANVDAEDARIVRPDPIAYKYIESASSQELFRAYAQSNPERLRELKIDEGNYIRKPNGTGVYKGVWVFPFPLDVWDYWINYRINRDGERVLYREDDFEYIPPPTTIVKPYTNEMHTAAPNEFVYTDKMLYLWDFIFNPEVVFSRYDALQQPRRRRKFPKYDQYGMLPNNINILPTYLPDTTFPSSFRDRYPWAAWEVSIDTSAAQYQAGIPIRMYPRRALSQTFIRAHGSENKTSPETDATLYKFAPHLATKKLSKVMRPLYPIEAAGLYDAHFAVPYGPLVLRDISPYRSNGWISLYRQQIRYSSDFFYDSTNKIWKPFIKANELLEADSDMTIDYASIMVLDKERREIWGRETDFHKMDRIYIPNDKVNTPEAIQLELLRELLHQAREIKDIFELISSTSGPVMENDPYLVVVVQIYENNPDVQRLCAFDETKTWALTVPPLLNVTEPGRLEVSKMDTSTQWTVRSKNEEILGVSINFDRTDINSAHQVRIYVSRPGEYKIYADVSRALQRSSTRIYSKYVFRVSLLTLHKHTLSFEYFSAPTHISLDPYIERGDAELATIQENDGILYSYESSEEYVKGYIEATWPKYATDARQNAVVTKGNFKVPVDFFKSIVIARSTTNPGTYYVFVFKLLPVVHNIKHFGEKVVMAVKYARNQNKVVWFDWHRYVLFENKQVIDVHIVSPKQLGHYTAEVYYNNNTRHPHHSVEFVVDVDWQSDIPRDYMLRQSSISLMSELNNPATYVKIEDTLEGYIETVYTLRSYYEGPFFMSMINVWARKYFIDLRNYAQCYPFVIQYCKFIDSLLRHNDRLQIVEELSPQLRQFLPVHIDEPLVNIKLTEFDEDGKDSPYAYVVLDPLSAQWINILALKPYEHSMPPSWLVPIPCERDLRSLYPCVSINMNIHTRRLEHDTDYLNDHGMDAWTNIKQQYDLLREEFTKIHSDSREISAAVNYDLIRFAEQENAARREFVVKIDTEIISNAVLLRYDTIMSSITFFDFYFTHFVACVSPCFTIQPKDIESVFKTLWDDWHIDVANVLTLIVFYTREPLFRVVWDALYEDIDPYTLTFVNVDINTSATIYMEFLDALQKDNFLLEPSYAFWRLINFYCSEQIKMQFNMRDPEKDLPAFRAVLRLTEKKIQAFVQP